MSTNKFTTFPNEVQSLSKLIYLYIYNNSINESLPMSVLNLKSLQVLYMYNNLFYGEIPKEYGQLVNLTKLRIDNNNLYGRLPAELGNLIKLTELGFRNNNLIGEIPSTFNNLTLINPWSFRVDNNNLIGTVPTMLKAKNPSLSYNMLDNEPDQYYLKSKISTININKGDKLDNTDLLNLYEVKLGTATKALNNQYTAELIQSDSSFFNADLIALKGGTTTIKVKIKEDSVGYINTTTENITVKIIDPYIPKINNITGNYIENGWINSDADLTIEAVGDVYCNLDNAGWVLYTNNSLTTEGMHNLKLKALNPTNSTESDETTINFGIDKTKPELTLNQKDAKTIELISSDNLSGVKLVEYNLNNSGFKTYTGDITLPPGSNTLEVRVSDNSGNVQTLTKNLEVDFIEMTISSNIINFGEVTQPSAESDINLTVSSSKDYKIEISSCQNIANQDDKSTEIPISFLSAKIDNSEYSSLIQNTAITLADNLYFGNNINHVIKFKLNMPSGYKPGEYNSTVTLKLTQN